MVRLSVNVNKVATLRNSRGGQEPRVLDAVDVCLHAGVPRHHGAPPRRPPAHHAEGRARHCRAAEQRSARRRVQHRGRSAAGLHRPGARGGPRSVHDRSGDPGEVTSQAGWIRGPDTDRLPDIIASMTARGIRVSLFVDPTERRLNSPAWSGRTVWNSIPSLSPAPSSRAPPRPNARLHVYARAAEQAHASGLGVNAGHDLDLTTWCCFVTCRIWMRCRSATRSCPGPSSSGWTRWSADTLAVLSGR